MTGTMNASVSDFTCTDRDSLDPLNRIPVKVDGEGNVWMGGRSLGYPAVLPCSSRGELVFAPSDTGVLLGPWGPDPDSYLILAGRFSGLDGALLQLTLEGGPVLKVRVPASVITSMQLKPRQRLWLSISLSALKYCR